MQIHHHQQSIHALREHSLTAQACIWKANAQTAIRRTTVRGEKQRQEINVRQDITARKRQDLQPSFLARPGLIIRTMVCLVNLNAKFAHRGISARKELSSLMNVLLVCTAGVSITSL